MTAYFSRAYCLPKTPDFSCFDANRSIRRDNSVEKGEKNIDKLISTKIH